MALPDLKAALVRATATATAAAALIASPAAVNDAQAQQQTAAQQVKIPLRDLRGGEPEGIRMAAAAGSRGGQVVVFFGDNQAAYDATVSGVRAAIGQGLPVKGIVLGSPIQLVRAGKTHSLNQVVFYADGDRTGGIDNPDGKVAADVTQHLRKDFEGIILPRRADAGGPQTK